MTDTTAMLERVAQITAHRACCGTEHDPANGKIHGYCVVCGVPWPCEYAGKPIAALAGQADAVPADALREAASELVELSLNFATCIPFLPVVAGQKNVRKMCDRLNEIAELIAGATP